MLAFSPRIDCSDWEVLAASESVQEVNLGRSEASEQR